MVQESKGRVRIGRPMRSYARRVVGEEILDSLEADSREAQRNRRELRWLNALMGNFGWFRQQIRERFPNGGRFLELGAGDGLLGFYLQERIPGIQVDGLDLWPRPEGWPEGWGWLREDLCTFEAFRGYDGVLCNLILHQFEEPVLGSLGVRIADAGLPILAAEPFRSRWPVLLIGLAFPFLGRVSRHDAVVSIRAGFRRGEMESMMRLPTGLESVSVMGTIRWVGG